MCICDSMLGHNSIIGANLHVVIHDNIPAVLSHDLRETCVVD